MKYKSLFLLPSILLMVWLSLAILKANTRLPNEKNNGFQRRWLRNVASLVVSKAIDPRLMQICGATEKSIFISSDVPSWVTSIDYNLELYHSYRFDLQNLKLKIIPNKIYVDSPNVYVHLNNMSSILSGRLSGGTFKLIKLNIPIFSRSLQLSDTDVIVRVFKKGKLEQDFEKVSLLSCQVSNKNAIFSERDDGGFTTDGSLSVNSSRKNVFFVEYFGNKIVSFKPDLTASYISKTIDTITDAGIQVLSDGHSLKAQSARVLINREIVIGDRYLFIESMLRSDDENLGNFNSNVTIDTYYIADGTYAGSFHVPRMSGEKLKSFAIFRNTLIALFSDKISIFSLTLK